MPSSLHHHPCHPCYPWLKLFFLFFLSAVPLFCFAEDVDVEVNVLGKAGKFNQANITREENKVIQAVFGGAPGDSLDAMISAPDGSILVAGTLAHPEDLSVPTFACKEGAGTAIVARLSSDLRTVQALFRLPPGFLTSRCLAVSPDGSVVVAGECQGGGIIVARLTPELN